MNNESNKNKRALFKYGGEDRLPEKLRIIFCYVIPILMVTGLIISGVWGSNQKVLADTYRTASESLYRQAYSELTDSVYALNVSLSKLLVSEAPSTLALTLDEIWRESGMIAGAMGRIPQSHVDSYELNRFLVQVGDYARGLSRAVLDGKPLTNSDRKQLIKLYEASERIYSELSEREYNDKTPVSVMTYNEFFSFSEQNNAGNDDAAAKTQGVGGSNAPQTDAMTDQMQNTQDGSLNNRENSGESGGQDDADSRYPTLIYDGPFSESTEKQQPQGLTGENIDESTALERAKAIIGEAAGELTSNGFVNGRIPAYDFSGTLSDGRSVDIAITMQGGALLWFVSAPTASDEGVPEGEQLDSLKNAGLEWLYSHDYCEMKATYAQYYPGCVLISYAAVQRIESISPDVAAAQENGDAPSVQAAGEQTKSVILYNDLVKLWIDRATGSVIGANAENYLFSHVERELSSLILSEDEARAQLSPNLEIEQTALALIPRPDLTERLCYEFKGSFSGNTFIVYIDAKTGDEIQIFRLISNENGELTL